MESFRLKRNYVRSLSRQAFHQQSPSQEAGAILSREHGAIHLGASLSLAIAVFQTHPARFPTVAGLYRRVEGQFRAHRVREWLLRGHPDGSIFHDCRSVSSVQTLEAAQ